MKKVAYIVLIGSALLALACGAWIADGVKWLGSARRRSRLEGVARSHALNEARRPHGPGLFTPGDPQHFAAA